jgi:bifunctional DNA-binding transcriptional regulator/antitoxin component of YhaV-PrlF toxin-antitoxin module
MVLPKDVRKALGIEGLKMTCGVIGNKVVLENYSGRLFARPLPNRRR